MKKSCTIFTMLKYCNCGSCEVRNHVWTAALFMEMGGFIDWEKVIKWHLGTTDDDESGCESGGPGRLATNPLFPPPPPPCECHATASRQVIRGTVHPPYRRTPPRPSSSRLLPVYLSAVWRVTLSEEEEEGRGGSRCESTELHCRRVTVRPHLPSRISRGVDGKAERPSGSPGASSENIPAAASGSSESDRRSWISPRGWMRSSVEAL